MLTALAHPENDDQQQRIEKEFAPECSKSKIEHLELFCPICEDELIFVSEGSDGTTAHFRHKAEPDHPRISEGKTHRAAKIKLYEELKEVNNPKYTRTIYEELTLEKILRPKTSSDAADSLFERDYQIADLYFEYNGNKCVVEFQCSSQGWRQFKLRTMYYNLHGYQVLWVLDKDMLSRDKRGRYICKEAFYNLSKMYDGRIYFFDSEKEVIFTGKFQNWESKTRASKLSTNLVKDLNPFKSDLGGLGDTFRFQDNLSYSDLNDGLDLEDNWKLGGIE